MPAFRVYSQEPSGRIIAVTTLRPNASDALTHVSRLKGPHVVLAAEPKPDPCPIGDYAFNRQRLELIRANAVPGSLMYDDARKRDPFPADVVAPAAAVEPEPAAPGPRKPAPAVPVEAHNSTPFDAQRAWEATKIAALGFA